MQSAVSNGLLTAQAHNESLKIIDRNMQWINERQWSVDKWMNDFYASSGNKTGSVPLFVLVALAYLRYLLHC